MSLRLLMRFNRLTGCSMPKYNPKSWTLFNSCKLATFKLEGTTAIPTTPPKKKTARIPKITLINPGDQLTVTTLEEAQKLSKRRDLKLVKIVDLDAKTERPVYKLMTGTEYHAEDLKRRAERKANKNSDAIKGDKLLTLSSRITDHDLDSRIKNISRWVAKNYEVRVVINGDSTNLEPAEVIYAKLENRLKTQARLLQKRQKGSDIRFQILPPKREKSTEDNQL